ncbi:MAG TPA: DUF362 domain-containing protein [Candidatus Latescibacteria bacterium]|nr:DUF362 domain-containing protein [Candidatus Latescibacterota bacterium]
MAERRGARLNFDTSVSEVPYPEASVAKRLEIIRPALEADLVINVPKLKTHVYTTFSGAVKNLFGLVPGYTKAGYHAKFNNLIYFSKMLLDIFNFVRPALNVMDGVVALEGDGPGWHGHPRKVGVVMASLDGLALDVAACRLVGIHPERVPTLEIAREQGLVDFEGIEIKGCQEKFVGFKMPSVCRDPAGYVQSGFFRSFVHPVLISMLTARPVPIEDRCSGCGTCLSACPRGAIEVRGGVAVVDHDLCIRCYCCHELCPYAAIDLRTSWLGRLLRRTGVMGRWSRGEISQ